MKRKQNMSIVNIAGLSKGVVLQALFNASKHQGLGFLQVEGAKPMTLDDANDITANDLYFDYCRGRVLKVDISGDEFEARSYDRDNGNGAAERAIAAIR